METKQVIRRCFGLARGVGFSGLLLVLAACGGAQVQVGTGPQTQNEAASGSGKAMAQAAAESFNKALAQLAEHDRSKTWDASSCAAVAKAFDDAAARQKAETGREFPEATYNAGLAFQRCKMHKEAAEKFQAALAADAKFHRARTQLALYRYRDKGRAEIDGVIAELQRAIADAQFQNVEALVNLAMLQMERNSQTSDQDGANDYDRAKKNLQRALAIDDGYQPAFNQLALYYLQVAKQRAVAKKARKGTKANQADVQQLELAALVCSQAIRKDPSYAPIHNTAGLIQVELQNINGAVQEFQTAIRLDPSFFEAQMNFAAINLSFRGFKAAEEAYRAALKIRPDDYDARLGLALAIRGQIDDANFDQYVAASQAELDQAKKLAPERPEAYYNEAILTHEFKAKGAGDDSVPTLEAAAKMFETFVQKAGADAKYADAVRRAKERVEDINVMVQFIKEGQSEAAIAAALQEKEIEEAQAEAAQEAQQKEEAPAEQ